MRAVNVVRLRNGLSKYLVAVQQGEEILIHARRRPVAKLAPVHTSEGTQEGELLLAAAGPLKLGEGSLPAAFWSKPAVRVSPKVLQHAIYALRGAAQQRRSRKSQRKRRG